MSGSAALLLCSGALLSAMQADSPRDAATSAKPWAASCVAVDAAARCAATFSGSILS